jgi:uncharacterized protein (TIGR00661 family)
MATIYLSMSGEGRGHATRAKTLVDYLKDEHRIILFAPADAYAFLAPIYVDDPAITVRKIPGVIFHYVDQKLDLSQSILEGLKYFRKTLYDSVNELSVMIDSEKPDLIITDWEPAMPRAALRCGVPFISLSHQHFLESYDLSPLPWSLRFHAWLMNWVVKTHYSGQLKTVVTGFFTAPLKKGYEAVQQIGPLIRPEIKNALPVNGDHYLSYLRKATPQRVVDELVKANRPIRIYGLGNRPQQGLVTFHAIDPVKFVDDLASAKAVICAAGNQLLGECLYLGKPVLALPEASHYEQLINSHFLRIMKCGDFKILERLKVKHILWFLDNLHQYHSGLSQTSLKLDGTPQIIDLINNLLHQFESHKNTDPHIPDFKLQEVAF